MPASCKGANGAMTQSRLNTANTKVFFGGGGGEVEFNWENTDINWENTAHLWIGNDADILR